GQAAFGAISEVVQILKADPSTDWTKVNIEALRQHLIDMDAVVMDAAVTQKHVPGGFEADVTGSGTTVASIQRLAMNHASMLNAASDVQATVVPLPTGVRFSITVRGATDVVRIRALGFAGMLTEGSHHQPHHLMIARGGAVHKH
ncbi:MAG: hypothetical protein H7Z40_07340, partial [Phycisphaerae bacterium]|nr:hypothetical protein [Gemmatimonadaceae bacterium]